jgi:hypothetical protein
MSCSAYQIVIRKPDELIPLRQVQRIYDGEAPQADSQRRSSLFPPDDFSQMTDHLAEWLVRHVR